MIQLPILAQGTSWIVINKPVGVSVHNDPQDVCALLRQQLKPGTFEDLFLVHRLDKETSGVLILALNSKAAKELAEQFQSKTCEKIYTAILRGTLKISDKTSSEWESWTKPISDKAEGRKNPQGASKDRISARTDYRLIKSSQYLSMIEVKLFTGRQHQIRKHSAMDNHSIVGDSRYGDSKYNSRMSDIYGTDRMFLHARSLKIFIEGSEHLFEAPIPKEFFKVFEEIS